jgi:hypothetical protein
LLRESPWAKEDAKNMASQIEIAGLRFSIDSILSHLRSTQG